MVLSFLLLSVYLFKFISGLLEKDPVYLTSSTAQVFIPLIRFRLDSFVSSTFLVLLRYSFIILFIIIIIIGDLQNNLSNLTLHCLKFCDEVH